MVAHKHYASLAAIMLALASSAAAAQQLGLGTPATPEQIAGWNIEIAPDGKNLPPGRGTIEMGKKVYDTQCLACHGAKLEGGIGPALAGGVGSLATDKPKKTVQSYWPYATTAFDYIRRAMPFQAPQSLSNDEVYAVTGYLLHEYGLISADTVVDADAIRAVKMPNKDGFYLDDRPDAKNERCMTDCLKKG
jgi:cytochrome c